MLSLIKNELIKLFKRKSSWIMQIILVLCMCFMAVMMVISNNMMKEYYPKEAPEFKGGMTAYQKSDGTVMSEFSYWSYMGDDFDEFSEISLTLDESISLLEKDIATHEKSKNREEKETLKGLKKELEYYQAYKDKGEQPANPREGSTSAYFFSRFGGIYLLPTLFAVVVASMIIASEFTAGTIKLLLIRPFSRSQILWSKYLVTIFYGFVSSVVMGVSAFAFSFLLPKQSLLVPLASDTGTKTGLELAIQLFSSNFLLTILYITIAFFFSAVIRSQALAVGVGMGILFSGSILGQILPSIIEKYEWLKWIIFNLLGLNNQVIDSTYMVGGNLSIPATIVGIIVYIVIIQAITLFIFNKRDVALT